MQRYNGVLPYSIIFGTYRGCNLKQFSSNILRIVNWKYEREFVDSVHVLLLPSGDLVCRGWISTSGLSS